MWKNSLQYGSKGEHIREFSETIGGGYKGTNL
jgi:hypothetical protein